MNAKTPMDFQNERQSMDDIAASFVVSDPDAPAGAKDAGSPEGKAPDDINSVADAMIEDDQSDADEQGEEEDPVVYDTDDGEEATSHEDDEDDEENFDKTSELTDDTKIAVTVDGEQREVTLAELKQRYSGEGAIDKRLQEATERRKEATNLKAQATQQLETGRQQLVTALNAVMQMVGQPTVERPDPALERANPTQYLLKMEQYRLDQERVQGRQSQIMGLLQQHEARQQQELLHYQQEQNAKLVEAWPDLANREKAPAAVALVQEAASAYGFSEHELSGPVDHRLFIMAADAARYRRMKQKQTINPKQENRKLRTMRPGAQQQVSATAKAKASHKAAVQRAKKTGSVDDVAALLITPSPKR